MLMMANEKTGQGQHHGRGLVIQLQDGENYVAVWPKNQAKTAPVLPYKGWQ
jgi:hypothetical protein